uniref:Uncharacterized protein n=1 Tax=Rhizophora mucronata TaxID=61149 RepID=A0A2P2LPN2_RHIMU
MVCSASLLPTRSIQKLQRTFPTRKRCKQDNEGEKNLQQSFFHIYSKRLTTDVMQTEKDKQHISIAKVEV